MRGLTGGAAVSALVALAAPASGQSYMELEYPPGSMVMGISASGEWTVGSQVLSSTAVALRWNAAGAVTPLTWPGADNFARAVSDSGAVIAGESDGLITVSGWDGPGLFFQPGPGVAFGMNADATVFVGQSFTGGRTAFAYRRVMVPAMVTLPPAAGLWVKSAAHAVNGAGTLAVGVSSESDESFTLACMWNTSGGAPQTLPPLPGDWTSSAIDLSESGAVVVGNSALSSFRAVRWVAGVPEVIAAQPFSSANAVSADGRIIVGSRQGEAFVWDHAHGVRGIRQVLLAAGVAVGSGQLTGAIDISRDGRVVVGSGSRPPAVSFLWRAVLPTICAADWNGDGLVDFPDYLAFLNDFEAASIDADLTGEGMVDFSDYLEFLNHFDAGC